MDTKRGTFFLQLLVACAALAKSPCRMPEKGPGPKHVIKRLMRKCQEKGYPVPDMKVLGTVFINRDLPHEDTDSGQSDNIPTTFINIMNSVSRVKDSTGRKPSDDDMTNINCSKVPAMIQEMRKYSEAPVCYIRAYIAPLSWWIVTTTSENNTDMDDYDNLLWAAVPMLHDMPFNRMKLPNKVAPQKVEKMMKKLREEYEFMSKEKAALVVQWVKQQIIQNKYNCTRKPSSDSRLQPIQHCKSSLKWLDFEKLTMLGPYLSYLSPDDVDSCPKEQLCKYFDSGKLGMAIKMHPSLASRLHQRFLECFNGEEFERNVDKLGILACYNPRIPDLTPDLSRKLLFQLKDCDEKGNPRIKQLKKRLFKSVMSKSNSVRELLELGNSFAFSPNQLSMMSSEDLRDIVKNLTIPFTRSQMRALIKKTMGDITCDKVLGKELIGLQSVAGGLPSCVLKHVKVQEILNDTEALENISKRMRKGQLKALLQSMRKNVDPSELVRRLQGPLLQSLSLTDLVKAKINSLDQVVGKTWSRSQAAYLAKKMDDMKQLWFRELHSVVQGITCKMIDEVPNSDVQDMVRDITDTPQRLSEWQVACAARRLVRAMESKRPDYFKTITGEELDAISIISLSHFPPSTLKDLPDSVCSVLLDKMEVADLRLLPLRSPSRFALTKRALHCVELTNEDMSRLGPLLCELKPSRLRLMAPDVLNSSLQAMASCQHIPQQHRADIIQLVTHTFGNTSEWSEETMEKMGPLILLDDNVTAALPNTPWMKDVLQFLRSRLNQPSDALRRKLFSLITATPSNAARKKREANSNGIDKDDGVGSSDNDTETGNGPVNIKVYMTDLIEELGKDNILWSPEELDSLISESFVDVVEILGTISDYSKEQLAVMIRKAVEAFGPLAKMNDSVVIQMGCITRGFSNVDLAKLPLSLDTLEEIAHCGWSQSQMETIWKAAAKYNNVKQLGAVEIASLSQFICGLNPSDFTKISIDAFREAVDTLANVNCAIEVRQQLKILAVSAFGEPRDWSQAHVSELGNIIAGLYATEFANLDPLVFTFISRNAIPLIPKSTFASLSVAQLEALGSENAAAVTPDQQAALGDDQRAALEMAITGSMVQDKPKSQSGAAPSLRVEGISALMKPPLFLILGFLLL